MKEDLELARYRDLLPAPTTWTDGFSVRSVIGCIFIGLVMMPASMYLGLLLGTGLSDAARWVTVVLFIELARRSFTTLKRPEIFVLFYMAGAVLASPFSSLLWVQYFVTSPAAYNAGIAPDNVPAWFAPSADVIAQRNFFHPGWLGPIAMIVLGQFLGRIDRFGLGYVLFRVTSDVEKLPFPMAPVGAQGITALAESSAGGTHAEGWRWRVFSIGSMIGLVFGALYVGLPALSSIFLKKPIILLEPIFLDFTTSTSSVLPATPVTLSLDLGNILVGMVLPFQAVLGSFLGLILTWIANPILHRQHFLHRWSSDMNAIDTNYANYTDFYLSFGIGIAMAIASVGFYHIFSGLRRAPKVTSSDGPPIENGGGRKSKIENLLHPPAGRGDISIFLGIAIYLFSTTTYIILCHFLVPDFPLWILLAYGFVYTPIISYVASRMEGIVGQWSDIPMLREATFIASSHLGYHGVGIWFAPIPMNNYHGAVVDFRTQELTGTKFTSLFKAEMIIFPVVIISSILCAQYLWKLAPIPSAQYPFANKMFEPAARQQALMQSSTLGDGHSSEFFQSIQWPVILSATGIGVGSYSLLSYLNAPSMLIYGLIRGLGAGINPGIFPQLLGALLARYFFEKRFGLKWRHYAPVLLAGFSCGMGLISMFSLGCLLISKAVFQLPY